MVFSLSLSSIVVALGCSRIHCCAWEILPGWSGACFHSATANGARNRTHPYRRLKLKNTLAFQGPTHPFCFQTHARLLEGSQNGMMRITQGWQGLSPFTMYIYQMNFSSAKVIKRQICHTFLEQAYHSVSNSVATSGFPLKESLFSVLPNGVYERDACDSFTGIVL